MPRSTGDRVREVLSRWGFSDLFADSGEASRFVSELEDVVRPTRLDEDKRLDDSGVPAWFTLLEKFKFGDHDGDGTLEMNIVENDDDEEGTFVRFIEAGDSLADLMRAAWMEENPVIIRKRLD